MTSHQQIVMQQRMEMLPKKHRNKMKLLHPLPPSSLEGERSDFLSLPRDLSKGVDPNASVNTDAASIAQNAPKNDM